MVRCGSLLAAPGDLMARLMPAVLGLAFILGCSGDPETVGVEQDATPATTPTTSAVAAAPTPTHTEVLATAATPAPTATPAPAAGDGEGRCAAEVAPLAPRVRAQSPFVARSSTAPPSVLNWKCD